jgi:ribosomal protein L37E
MTKKTKVTKNLAEKQMRRDFLKAMATMNKRMGSVQMGSIPKKSKANAMPKANPMPNPMPNPPMIPMGQNGIGSAICSRCGHSFKPTKPLKECPECGLTVAEEIDGELEWTEEMQEPIPQFVYNSQSPEEIFYKSIKWHYDKWMKIHKNNPSASIGRI